MKSVFLTVLLLMIISLCSSDEDDINVIKQKILDDLLNPARYDKRVRPQGNEPTNVTISMYVLDVYDMNQYLTDFTMQCYFRQKWRDPRLDFKDSKDDDETKIRKIRSADAERIWKPDLFFVNEIKGENHDLMVPNNFLRISREGEILFSTRVSVILSCHSDLEFYPHDEQECFMEIESYGYSYDELSVDWDGENAVGFSGQLTSNFKYVLHHHEMKVTRVTVNDTVYSRAVLKLHFARNSHTFLISVYLPHILLVILSWAAFCIDHRNVTLRLIYLGLIMFLMLRLVPVDKEPDLHITALDAWVAVCVTFILSSFLESIFVNQLASQEDTESQKEQEAEQKAINSEHMDVEKAEKKSDSSERSKLFERFARKYPSYSKRVDAVSRVASPVLFLLFNIVYWSVCCSASKYH